MRHATHRALVGALTTLCFSWTAIFGANPALATGSQPALADVPAETYVNQVRSGLDRIAQMIKVGVLECSSFVQEPMMLTYPFGWTDHVVHSTALPLGGDAPFVTSFVSRCTNSRGNEAAQIIFAWVLDAECDWPECNVISDTGRITNLDPDLIGTGGIDTLPVYYYVGLSQSEVTTWASYVPVSYTEGPNDAPTVSNPFPDLRIQWALSKSGLSSGDVNEQVVVADASLVEYGVALVLAIVVGGISIIALGQDVAANVSNGASVLMPETEDDE